MSHNMGRTSSAAVLLVAWALSPSLRAAPATTSVTILVVTPFGEVLQPVEVMRFAKGDIRGRDYAQQFRGARAEGIPFGPYYAQVKAAGRRIAGDVRVGRADTLIVLSGPEVIIERGPGAPETVGKVVGLGGNTPVWVRIVKVFSEDYCCTIVPVSEDGSFFLGGMEEGDYILLLLTDRRVLFEGRIRIEFPGASIVVDLTKGQVAVQRL
jgi:hypothetical protein